MRRSVDGRRRFLGVSRRLLTRALSRLPPIDYVAPSLPLELGSHQGRARLDVAAGRFWMEVEQPHRAQRCLERAVRRGNLGAREPLGRSLLAGGPVRLGFVEYLGLALRPIGDPASARRIFESMMRSGDESSGVRRALAGSLLDQHRVDEAARLVEAGDGCDDLRAEVAHRELQRAGSVTRTDLRTVTPILEAHLARHSGDTAARQRLAQIHLSLLDFDAAVAVAAGIPAGTLRSLAEWTRSTAAGEHRAAHRTKRSSARRLADAPARRTGPVADLVLRLQAINYVEGPEAAIAELDRRWLVAATGPERQIRTKVRADLSLLRGETAPLRRFARTRPTSNDDAELEFHSMVVDKKVLVVGPSPVHQPGLELVADHDTIVTTRRPFVADGDLDRDTIVYLTNESARDELTTPTIGSEGARPLLVLRPSTIRKLEHDVLEVPRVRIQPFEDSTPLFGTHFAMQRIIHDLLAQGAAQVTISGVDFFLGEQTHVDGYDAGSSDRFATVPFNFSHDFAYDFWYTKTLVDRGLVHAPPEIGNKLDQSVESYLACLGRIFM